MQPAMADDWPLTHPLPDRVPDSPIRRQRLTLLLAVLSVASMSFTVFFAYNSSSEQPVSSMLIFERPERSILVLNIVSQITIYCLAELTLSVFDSVRWAFACSTSGISAYTFLALSRATNVIGVLYLILGNGVKPGTIQGDGHRLWGGQRYVRKFSMLIKDCFS